MTKYTINFRQLSRGIPVSLSPSGQMDILK